MKNMEDKIYNINEIKEPKKRIIYAAMDILNNEGIEKFNVRNVCEKAKVSIGSFYHYFKSIESILQESYNLDSTLNEMIKSGQLDKVDSVVEKINLLFEYQINYALSYGATPLSKYYIDILKKTNHIDDIFLDESRTLFKTILSLVIEGQENKIFTKKIDAQNITLDLIVIVRGVMFSWCLSSDNFDLHERVNRLLQRYFVSIKF